jgi:hypothetical protein
MFVVLVVCRVVRLVCCSLAMFLVGKPIYVDFVDDAKLL